MVSPLRIFHHVSHIYSEDFERQQPSRPYNTIQYNTSVVEPLSMETEICVFKKYPSMGIVETILLLASILPIYLSIMDEIFIDG